MASSTMHIRIVGVKQTRAMFDRLPVVMQKDTARKVLRTAVKRTRAAVATAAPKDTGRLEQLIRDAPVRSRSRTRNLVRLGWLLPTREQLGIAAYTPEHPGGYYPTALEYGFRLMRGDKFIKLVAPKRYIRGTVDKVKSFHLRVMGVDFGKRTMAAARKLGNHKRVA